MHFNSRKPFWRLAAGAAIFPLAISTAAFAQTKQPDSPVVEASEQDPTVNDGGLAEIVVTGTKLGTQNLQRTSVAVTVVGSELMESQGLSTVQDIAKYVPNLTFSRNTGQAIVYVRGIGSSNAGVGSDPSVTQQVDGVYIARPTAQIGDFLDVERIEVLRGPQGTLYGRNAVGGTINVVSRQPSDTFGGRIRVGYGNYDAKSFEAYFTGPISGEALTASIAGTYRDHDPYYRNIVPGVPSFGSAKRFGVRGQLRWEPTSDIDITLRADYSRIDEQLEVYDHLLAPVPFQAPLANSLVGSYREVAVGGAQPIEVDNGGVSLEANYNLGGGLSLKSVTAWRKLKSDLYVDSDGTEVFISYLHQLERQTQFTQEFNLSYQGDRLKAVAGVFFFGDRDVGFSQNTAPVSVATPPARAAISQANSIVPTRSYAAFIQANYEIVPDLTVIMGLRYTTETKKFDQDYRRTSLNPAMPGANLPGFPSTFLLKRKDDAFTPKFGLDYQVTPDVMLYASATRGFKSGGFNNSAQTLAAAQFAPEYLWAYEAGAKTQFLDRRLRINATGFIYNYSDLQVRQLLSPGNAVISNAATASIKGVELEMLGKPTSDLQISGSLSYLHTRYQSFPNASVASAYSTLIPNQTCVAGVCTFDATGNRLEATPRWSGVVGIDYNPRIGDYQLDVHVDWARRGRAYFDASNLPISSQPAYSLINASIGIGPETGWKAELFVRNAANKKYYQVIAGNGVVPGAISGEPRIYGLRLGYSF